MRCLLPGTQAPLIILPLSPPRSQVDPDYKSRMESVLTTIPAVNKSDVATLATSFDTLRDIIRAPMEEIALLPGVGEKKIKVGVGSRFFWGVLMGWLASLCGPVARCRRCPPPPSV